jgi:hypothetical protein
MDEISSDKGDAIPTSEQDTPQLHQNFFARLRANRNSSSAGKLTSEPVSVENAAQAQDAGQDGGESLETPTGSDEPRVTIKSFRTCARVNFTREEDAILAKSVVAEESQIYISGNKLWKDLLKIPVWLN